MARIDRTRTATAYSGGSVNINIFPTPKPKMEQVTTEKKTYFDADGNVTLEVTTKRAKRQMKNEAGQLLYTDADGDTVNRTSRDGLTVNAPKMESYTQPVTEMVPVMAADGVTPRMDYASVSANIRVIDTKGRPYPESDSFTEEELSEDQQDRLIALWAEVLAERAAAQDQPWHATPDAAIAAGDITIE